ncbi:MAG TPA: tetratricopeptide repeat protein [Nitrospira sp.]|nr:tetratricopeptide repeat protein [Nitrospira sp.]
MGIDRSKVLHSAQLFASKGQYDAAINEWKKLSAESPADGSIYNSIGELHLKRNATGEAVAAFLQSANAFRAEGATLKAIATYKKVLKLDPSRYDIYRFLGDLNAERGLLSSAVQDYLTLGKFYLKERKTKEALEIYKKIVSQDPSNLDAQQRVAELCVQENMQDEATKVYLQLGRERSAQQRYGEAKEAYQSVLRIDPNNSEATQFIEHFEKTGGGPGPSSRGTSQTGTATGKSLDPMDLLAEARRRIDEKQYAGAEAILNQLLSKEPGNPQVCQLLAKLHLQQGQLQVALGEYRFLAGAALRAQEYTQAETLIKEFLTVEPDSVPLLELHGELYEEQGDAQSAVEYYGKAVEVLLKHPEPGMPTLHEEIFDKIRSLAPDSPVVHRLMSLMQREPSPGDHIEPATSPIKHAVPTLASSKPTEATSNPAEEFSLAGAAPDDAWNLTSTIDRGHDRHLSLPANGSDPVSSASHPAAAGDPTDEAIHGGPEPSSVPAKQAQFQSYLEAGQLLEAELWLARLLNQEPNDAEARTYLGQILERKGDPAGASIQYGRALELLMASEGPSEACNALYLKIKELTPTNPLVTKLAASCGPPPPSVPASVSSADPADGIDMETHYTLGVAYKNMGLLEEAKEEFLLSMKSPTVFLDSCLMTAVCLKEQGNVEAASAQLERLLSDPRCQGAKAQAIRYELGLLYERQAQWQRAVAMFESIPTFHDVPERLSSLRTQQTESAPQGNVFRYAS